jgi:lysophospholipase L1-like esterase
MVFKRFFFWVGLAVCMLLPAGLAELGLRLEGVGNPILYTENASYRYAPLPNQKEIRFRGASVTIDSIGLRGVTDWTTPADTKILFLGDSVTWGGTGIDDRETFANLTCVRLEERIRKHFLCGNAGVNAYGTDNMAQRILYKDFDDESAVVVTLISADTLRGLTDLRGQPFYSRAPSGPFRALWEALGIIVFRLSESMRTDEASRRPDHDLRVAEYSLDNLTTVLHKTYGAERKVLIVLSPTKDELDGKEKELTRHVRALLARSDFDFIDMTPDVAASNRESIYYDRAHLDVAGHQLYADRIANRLEPYFRSRH